MFILIMVAVGGFFVGKDKGWIGGDDDSDIVEMGSAVDEEDEGSLNGVLAPKIEKSETVAPKTESKDKAESVDEEKSSIAEKAEARREKIRKSRRVFVYEIVHEDGTTTTVNGALGANLKTKAEREAEAAEKAAALAKRMDHSSTRSRAKEIYTKLDPVAANANSTAIIEEVNRVYYEAVINSNTVAMPAEVESPNAILINMDMGFVVAEKASKDRIYPASMTKVMTVLVAADALRKNKEVAASVSQDDAVADSGTGSGLVFPAKLKQKVPVSTEATSYAFRHDCSTAGFSNDEVVTVEDLFYGTILPSGGDAAYQLAVYIAGSHENFVDMMNKKLDEMGLSETSHFTNCVGLYDDNHYSTCYDIAMIMEAAMADEFCYNVLSTHYFVTSSTTEHPDGLELSNWFLRRIEDKEFGGVIEGAKTGYVNESGNCAVSTENSLSGTHYLCVTAGAESGWKCIYDHVDAYSALGR